MLMVVVMLMVVEIRVGVVAFVVVVVVVFSLLSALHCPRIHFCNYYLRTNYNEFNFHAARTNLFLTL